MGRELSSLEDALAVIRDLSAFIHKQAEEILNLKKELAATRAEIITLKTENAALKKQNAKLEYENAWLKRQIFGSKSERFLPTADQSGLLPGFEETSEPVVSVELQTVAEHTRKVREKNGWDEIPADLPREDRIIDIPAEKRQGMELIGYEDSERLAVRSGLYVIRYRRAKYAASGDPLQGVRTAPAPGDYFNSPSGKTKYDVSIPAKVIADKTEHSIPLERQVKMFASEGVQIAPSTLAHLFKNGAQSLKVLYDRMVELIMECEVLHVDETFLKLAVPGHGKCKTAYFWCRMTGIGPPMVAFHFSPSRSQDVAQLLLGDYSGTIIRDSYVGYENLSCEAACCWSHMRRRVFDAHKAGFVKSARMLDMIRDLYRLERIAKDKAEAKGSETALFQARKTVRRESQKIVDNIFALCREWQHNELPSSPLAKAATYALNIENELKKFLDDPKLNLDNNPAEIQMRRIAIGRRNWLFTGSETGGQNLAILFSFAATCKANGVNYRQWLEDILIRINTTPASQIDSLLPQNWDLQPTLKYPGKATQTRL